MLPLFPRWQECETEISEKSLLVSKLEAKTHEISRMLTKLNVGGGGGEQQQTGFDCQKPKQQQKRTETDPQAKKSSSDEGQKAEK